MKKGVGVSRVARINTNEGNSADEVRILLVIKALFVERCRLGQAYRRPYVPRVCRLVVLLTTGFELFPRKDTILCRPSLGDTVGPDEVPTLSRYSSRISNGMST